MFRPSYFFALAFLAGSSLAVEPNGNGTKSSAKSFSPVAARAPVPAPALAAKPTDNRPTPAPVGTPQTYSPAPGAPDMVTLQYPNSDVADILHLYEQLTGKKLVMDNFVQGKVNIFISKPVPRDEAIKIIQINLLLNGYSLVPAEGDIVKVIGTGKNPRTAGVPIISDEADIPEGDQVVSFLFKLHYADPTELQQVLGQYLSPPQPYTSFLALPKASAILITENTAVIRSLVHIIDQVDIPPAEVVSEFIKLNRADATKVVDMLKDIFEKGNQPTGPTGPGGIRAVRPNIPAPVAAQNDAEPGSLLTALSEDSIVVGKIKIAADVRTNRIHVITRPINMPFVRKLIAEFDANVEFAKPVTRPLRYVSAADVLPVLVQALTEPGEKQGEGANGATSPQQQQQQQRRTTGTNNSAGTTDASGGTSGGGSQSFSEELSTTAVDTTPKAVTVGNAKIIADQRANAIIVLGNKEVVVKVEKILDEMDVSSPQVALSTVIGSLTLQNEEDFGVDFFARNNRRVAGVTNFTGLAPTVTNGTVNTAASPATTAGGTIFNPGVLGTFTQLATSAASTTGGSTNIYLAAGSSLATIVHALNTTGRFKTLSRPTVYTSNNKKAIIASGQEIPIPVNSYSTPTSTLGVTTGTAFANSSSIEYKKVALQLEVVPLINSEKYVSLDILQKVDSLTGQSTNVNGNLIPTIQTRYIKTNVSAPNGSTIILGGLIEDAKTTGTSGLPVLSRLPLVGALFRSTTKSKTRTELLVLMRPEVTLTEMDVARFRQKSEDKTHFGAELESDDCPDCPKPGHDEKQVSPGFEDGKPLPSPDLPPSKDK